MTFGRPACETGSSCTHGKSPRSLYWSSIDTNDPSGGAELSEWAWGNTDDEAAKRTIKVIARLHFKLGQTDLPRCPVEVAPGFGYWYRTSNA